MDREKWAKQATSFLKWSRKKAEEMPERAGFLTKKEALALSLGWNPKGNCKSNMGQWGMQGTTPVVLEPGIVVPTYRGETLARIDVVGEIGRQPSPVAGSADVSTIIRGSGDCAVLLPTVNDALLAWHASAGQLTCIAGRIDDDARAAITDARLCFAIRDATEWRSVRQDLIVRPPSDEPAGLCASEEIAARGRAGFLTASAWWRDRILPRVEGRESVICRECHRYYVPHGGWLGLCKAMSRPRLPGESCICPDQR